MVLNPHQIEQFKSEGYTTVPDWFSAREVRAMQSEVERWQREGLMRNVSTDGDGKTPSRSLRNLQLIPLYPVSPLFAALPLEPKVIDTITTLIGSPIILHLDQSFHKPAKDGTGTNWHQDNAYFKIGDPMKGTAMWIAVHDATLANGTLHVIPGSFKEQYEHRRDPYSNYHICCDPPEERAVALELPAGGVALFCYGTAHSTKANTTDKGRTGVALHFLNVDYARDDLIAEGRDCRPYLSGPEASGGVNEYGHNVAGTWEQEVTHILART